MAGEGDAERLVVLLEARVRDFEKNLQKASGTARRQFDDITAGSSRASRTMSRNMADAAAKVNSSLASFGKGFVGGLAAGAVAEFTTAVKGAVTSVANLKAEAQQAGIGVEAFQRLQIAATQAKVGTDALVDGLKEMQLRIDEFVQTGGGAAAESLRRIGLDADQLKVKLKNPSDLFLELISRIQRLDQAARIRVADELFGGTAGEQFVRLVDLGAEKVRTIGDDAESAGRIIDTALVDRAAELDLRFNDVANTIRTKVVQAVLAASDSLDPLIAQANALDRSLVDLYNNPSKENFNKFMFGSFGGYEPTPDLDPAEARRESERGRALSNLGRPAAPAGPALVDQGNLPPTPERKPNLLSFDPAGGGRAASAAAARTERDAVNELIASLEEELRLVGQADVEHAVSNNLRAAGADATEVQRERIESLTRAYAANSEAAAVNADAMAAIGDVASGAFKGFLSDILAGASAADALKSSFDDLAARLIEMAADVAIQMILNALMGGRGGGLGGGLGGGIISTIMSSLGGGFANGAAFAGGNVIPFARGGVVSGPTVFPMANGMGLMGEAGPEAVMPLRRGNDGRLGVAAGGQSAAPAPVMVQVNVSNNAPVEVQTHQRQEGGGLQLDVSIDEIVASKLADPGSKSSKTMRSGWGVKPGMRRTS